MQLFEPQWWVILLQQLNTWVSTSNQLFNVVSFLADAVVFLFPIFLIVIYIYGITKKQKNMKIHALRIFSSAFFAAVINIIFQLFFHKDRPETVLEGTQRLILKHLPTMSFPSDHAAVSMAFASAILLWIGLYEINKQKKNIIYTGVFFLIAGIIMSICRVVVGIHRPTDILAGWVVWLIAAYISIKIIPISFYNWIISIEEMILKKLSFLLWKIK